MDVGNGTLVAVMLSIVLFMGGCASMGELTDEVIKAKNSGKEGFTRVYPVTENQAWDLTRTVFRREKADEIEANEREQYVIAATGMKMVVFGSVMGVWFQPVDSEHTLFTVLTRRRAGENFPRLTATRFYEKLDEAVNTLQTGKTPPYIHHGD